MYVNHAGTLSTDGAQLVHLPYLHCIRQRAPLIQGKKMKLLEIIIKTPEKLAKIPKSDYWILNEPYAADFVTDIGTFRLRLRAGWITDFRSGSSVIDWIVPKKGNAKFNATIFLHDTAFSGHIPKDEADELLRQGLIMSGLATWRANAAYNAVQLFGGSAYYDLETPLKTPYELNREAEYLELESWHI